MNNRCIGMFLLIALGGAWSVWGLAWLLGVFDDGPMTAPAQVVVAFGAFAPAVAAYVVRRWVAREGFADAGLGLHLRNSWPYYVVGWLLPLPVVGCIAALAGVFGFAFVHSDLSVTMVLGALVSSLVLTPLFFGEEFGWRGYLQVRLVAGRPILAAVLTGLVWGVFHYPLIVLGFEGYENIALGLIVFPVFTVLMSIMLGWLRQRTGGIWAGCLAHSAADMTGGLSAYLFYGNGQWILTSYAGVLAWIPLGVVCAWIVLTSSRRTAHRRVVRDEAHVVA
jgi:membrane protease YdiL (CAAX protease family)